MKALQGFGRTARWLCAAAMGALLGAPPAAAQSPLVLMVMPRPAQEGEAAFQDTLRKRGFKGRFETVVFSGKAAEQPALVAKIREIKPALIYTYGTPSTLAVVGPFDATLDAKTEARADAKAAPAQAFVRDIPVVFADVTDPVASKVVAPGTERTPQGQVTGVSHVAPLAVQLQALGTYRAGQPPLRRLGYLVNPAEANTSVVLERLKTLAQTSAPPFEVLSETLATDAAGAPEATSIAPAVQRLKARGAQWLYIGPSTFLAFSQRDVTTQAALDAGLPTFCATESVVRKSKCLFGLFSNSANVGRLVGDKAAAILLGRQSVSAVPVETLQRFSMLVNLPVALALKQYPPLGLLDVAEVLPATAAAAPPVAAPPAAAKP